MAWEILELKTPWPLVNVEEEDGELVVRFHSEGFLWPSVDEVGKALLSLVDETDGNPFVLDFDNVDYITGVGLEKLVVLNNQLKINGRRLVIKNVAPDLMNIFTITGLTKVFDINPPRGHRFSIAKMN